MPVARDLVLSLAITSSVATAQRPEWRLSIGGGTATDERGVATNAVTVAPSLSVPIGTRVSLGVSGAGTRFHANGWQVGAATAAAAQSRAVAGATLFINAQAGASRSSFGTTFSSTDALGGGAWSAGSFSIFAGARTASGRTVVQRADGPRAVPGESTVASQTIRSGLTPAFGASWVVASRSPVAPLRVDYREERSRIAGTSATDRIADVQAAIGRTRYFVASRMRSAPSGAGVFVSAGASVAVTPMLTFEGAAGRYPADLLTGVAAGRHLSAGLVIKTGGSRLPQLPTPQGVERPRRGHTRLAIRAPQAEFVELYGDWNDWTPVRATRARNGVWYLDLPLDRGEYRYAFRINGVEWRVPEGAAVARDGFGGQSALVVVSRGSAQTGSDPQEES